MPRIMVLAAEQVWVFDQDKVWTADGKNVFIADMSDGYRRNVIAWLERQVEYIAHRYLDWKTEWLTSRKDDMSEMTFEQFSDDLNRSIEQIILDPMKWLHSTKLYYKLSESSATMNTGHGDPWAAEGEQ